MEFTFNDVSSLGDAHKQYMYKLVIAPLPGTGGIDERTLSMRNVSASIPSNGNRTIRYNMGGYDLGEAGLNNQQHTWQATFVEPWTLGVRKRMDNWLELCNQRKTNLQTPKTIYQTTADLFLQNGMHENVYQGRFLGFFIESIGQVNLENRGQNVTTESVTFAYDLFDPQQ